MRSSFLLTIAKQDTLICLKIDPFHRDFLSRAKRGHAKTTKSCARPKAKSRGQRTAGKLRLYEILYTLNEGFEQVLG
jgi:hypothetical protein